MDLPKGLQGELARVGKREGELGGGCPLDLTRWMDRGLIGASLFLKCVCVCVTRSSAPVWVYFYPVYAGASGGQG